MSLEIGATYDFLMKPAFMRSWKLIRETKGCYCIGKARHGNTLIPKKLVIEAYIKSENQG